MLIFTKFGPANSSAIYVKLMFRLIFLYIDFMMLLLFNNNVLKSAGLE